MRPPGVRRKTFPRPHRIYLRTLPIVGGLFYLMPGYPVAAAYYPVSVRCSLVLPSASFSQHLAVITLPRLVNRYNSAHRGLSPPSFTPCPASHHYLHLETGQTHKDVQ